MLRLANCLFHEEKFAFCLVFTGVQPSLDNQKLPIKIDPATADFGQNKNEENISVHGQTIR
jgi:hypothetical protein